MELQVTLNVTFKNETQSFLVSDPENTTWADVEAMVKVSFDLNTIQIKYLDEENEEVSINSQGEYEEALKLAVKQGNQLQMQVHEGYHVVNETPPPVVPEKRQAARAGKKPLAHYSSLVRVLGSDMRTPEEPTARHFPLASCNADRLQIKPPDWFTSYLETFREQIVKETVEKLEQKLHEKLVLRESLPLGSGPSEVSVPISGETMFLPENQFNWHIACSNCQRRIIGVRYQCSVCPSYNICEDCEAGLYAHDSNHVLLKLRRPVASASEPFSHSKFSTPRLPAALEQVRLQKQVDKNFLKAEKQRLRAEKKQRKAEVKELKKQLKLHRKIHLWNSIHGLQSPKSPLGRPESLLQSNTLMLPLQPCAPVMPTLSAAFVDENLPDGTHLQPGTKFIKHWRMKNTGNVKWSADTKLKFMWGNLTLASTERKDVFVPCLKAGHVGVVSVEFIAPALEGTYTSHWRLSHKGQQFGPRIWCSIIVDPFPTTESSDNNEKDVISSNKAEDLTCQQEEAFLLAKEIQVGEVTEQKEGTGTCLPQKDKNAARERELYIPSVDLLTAQVEDSALRGARTERALGKEGAPFLEVLQYQVDARSGRSKPLFHLPTPKTRLIHCPRIEDVSDIKLIRTDTTLDLSQKAEKRWRTQQAARRPPPITDIQLRVAAVPGSSCGLLRPLGETVKSFRPQAAALSSAFLAHFHLPLGAARSREEGPRLHAPPRGRGHHGATTGPPRGHLGGHRGLPPLSSAPSRQRALRGKPAWAPGTTPPAPRGSKGRRRLGGRSGAVERTRGRREARLSRRQPPGPPPSRIPCPGEDRRPAGPGPRRRRASLGGGAAAGLARTRLRGFCRWGVPSSPAAVHRWRRVSALLLGNPR
ncbi:LOW QUALITY PROTEIN: next to BRCA1 gene 1 protein [Dasypus novemcinctus]|uniref:LOW QUALITY PROTEIN: next to BRCA1 gene 1 protein n=1 Tax=Dasypus novemcinctus TaxID=9361 RepID=UPI00265F9F82|nr:LOW QUALITY PROTEIN: next to BRCA1 gene 1 protein [Dasypus novemcinctus]